MNRALTEFAEKAGSYIGRADDQQKKKIQSIGLPKELEKIFVTSWLQNYGQIEALVIFDIQSICEKVDEEHLESLPLGGFLPIGKAPNGDIIVVSFSHSYYPVGFIQLAEWNVDLAPNENTFVEIAESINEFIRSAIKKKNLWQRLSGANNLPVDSYDTHN